MSPGMIRFLNIETDFIHNIGIVCAAETQTADSLQAKELSFKTNFCKACVNYPFFNVNNVPISLGNDRINCAKSLQYIPRNMHTVLALLCFVVVIYWLIFPYPSGLLHCHCGNLTIAPVPAKQHWWIWINTSCEFIMNDCITTTKQSTTKPCAYFLGYTVYVWSKCNRMVGYVNLYLTVIVI